MLSFAIFPFKTKYPAFSLKNSGSACADELMSTELLHTAGKPFFNILTDNGIANLFLEAVAANPDEAWSFVSKHYINTLDLDALRDVLRDGLGENGRMCPSVVKAAYSSDPKNCLTRSVLVMDTERNSKKLLHLHMIREPDRFGQWKIYGVEQE